MGVRFPSAVTTTIVNNPGAGPSNQVVCTTPPISQSLDGQLLIIMWWMVLTTGATGPIAGYDIRRGTTTAGTILTSGQPVTELANVTIIRSGAVIDTPSNAANVQYSLCFNSTNASSPTTVRDILMAVFAL